MKENWKQRGKGWVIGGITIAVTACVCSFLLDNLSGIGSLFGRLLKVLEPFVIGLAVAFLINLPMVFIENNLKRRAKKRGKRINPKLLRLFSLGISVLLLLLLLALFVLSIGPQLAASATAFTSNIKGYLDELNLFIKSSAEQFHLKPELVEDIVPSFDQLVNYVVNFFSSSVSGIISTVSTVGNTMLNTVIGVIISIYFLASKEMFFSQGKKILYSLLKRETVDKLIRIAFLTNRTFTGFVSGSIVDSLMVAILTFVCLIALKIPYALLIAVIVGMTNIIPFFGPIIGAVPSVLIVLLVDPPKAIILLVYLVVMQQIEGNVIAPRVLGDSTGLPSLWVMFATLVGGGLFGFVGMLVSVPFFAVVYMLVRETVNACLEKKGLSSKSVYYRRPGALQLPDEKEEEAEDQDEKKEKKDTLTSEE